MKTLKMLKAAILIVVIAITTGCSDQLTSTGVMEQNSSVNDASKIHAATHYEQIRLKPNRSFTFDGNNTSLSRFYSVRVEEIGSNQNDDRSENVCNKISVFSASSADDRIFQCTESGFDVSGITIQNNSSEMLDLMVTVTGKLKDKLTK